MQSIAIESLYHNWTYINEVETYAFDGQDRVLVGKTKIDQFYDENIVRSTTENLLSTYIEAQMKLNGTSIDKEQLNVHEERIKEISKMLVGLRNNIDKKIKNNNGRKE